MPKSYLPTVDPPRPAKKLRSWDEIRPGYFFGFVSNLKTVGLTRYGGKIFIDIDAAKLPLMTAEDWAEVQKAAKILLVDAPPLSPRPCEATRSQCSDGHASMTGHDWHCPGCDIHLTSGGVCPACGERWDMICESCQQGDVPKLLDSHGVVMEKSDEPPEQATWCHAYEDSWWSCDAPPEG